MPVVVEGRTESQINAAKRGQISRLGGTNLPKLKRKRCKKGKSCGASCIPGYHVCMVDIPWALNPSITKVAKQIQSISAKNPKPKPEGFKPPNQKPKKPFKLQIPEHEVPEPVNKAINNMVNFLQAFFKSLQ